MTPWGGAPVKSTGFCSEIFIFYFSQKDFFKK
jgi:hypothetical protein